ncbi:MAG: rod shape-determining protein MreC [Candidatus Gribaldobacteria bacterium]|nr:rod shape-determining protein MreC [Candidatus Gribaldobacteria bacterium]
MKKKAIIYILITIIVILIVIFGGKFWSNGFLGLTAPLQKSLWNGGGGTKNFFSALFNSQKNRAENEKLLQENTQFRTQLVDLDSLKNENQTLKTALDLKNNQNWQMETADIVSRELNRDILTINKGTSTGLKKGMPVINPEGALVGVITETLNNFSKVMLITDAEFSFNIEIQTDKKPSGIARGNNNLNLSFEYIPKEITINQGNLALTTALGNVFPKNILVGTVATVEKNDAEPYQKGSILPAFTQNMLKNVLIIKDFPLYEDPL